MYTFIDSNTRPSKISLNITFPLNFKVFFKKIMGTIQHVVTVVQSPSHVQLCDLMVTWGFPVPHHLPKFTQVHFHCISDAIQPSHPLIPSSSALDFSQHQGLFQWVVCSYRWRKHLNYSFCISPSSEYSGLISLRLTDLTFLLSKGLSGVFSSTAIQRHVFFGILPSLLSSSHNREALTADHWEDYSLDYTDLCQQGNASAFQHTV